MNSEKHDFGLSCQTLQSIRNVLEKYPQISQAILYGSRAKGNFQPGSDIDLTLKGTQLTVEILLKVDNALDDLLLPYKFDLSIYDKITDQSFINHIERIGKIFFTHNLGSTT